MGGTTSERCIRAAEEAHRADMQRTYERAGRAKRVDMVNQPPHYQLPSGMEVADIIQTVLSTEEYAGFCKGNVLKYLMRAEKKGGKEDYEKAAWYYNRLQQEAGGG